MTNKSKERQAGEVVTKFLSKLQTKFGAVLDEQPTGFKVLVKGVPVSMVLKRGDVIIQRLYKFKPENSTMSDSLSKNVSSYGRAGYFYTTKDVTEAVNGFGAHLMDLSRVEAAKERFK